MDHGSVGYEIREAVIAWVERRGTTCRFRYRTDGGGYGSISGFASERAEQEYVADLATDRRRGVWVDPAGSKIRVADWVQRWVETIDVEPLWSLPRIFLRGHRCAGGLKLATVAQHIAATDSAICSNIATLTSQRDLLSQNVLSQLRNMVEGVAVRLHTGCGNSEYDYAAALLDKRS